MVFTIEPGVYLEGSAASATPTPSSVTDDGIELLTDYPRDIDELVIAAS